MPDLILLFPSHELPARSAFLTLLDFDDLLKRRLGDASPCVAVPIEVQYFRSDADCRPFTCTASGEIIFEVSRCASRTSRAVVLAPVTFQCAL